MRVTAGLEQNIVFTHANMSIRQIDQCQNMCGRASQSLAIQLRANIMGRLLSLRSIGDLLEPRRLEQAVVQQVKMQVGHFAIPEYSLAHTITFSGVRSHKGVLPKLAT
jgi:hypothetical protein